MDNFTFTDMQNMQRELQEKYKEQWGGLSPEEAKSTLLWLYGELGEVGDIIKKQGSSKIINDEAVRAHFVEELCDVMMYFNDLMLCYDISPEEFERIYREKHHTNMGRW